MIIVTGAAGFIGSNMVAKLNEENYRDIVLVDDFSRADKNKNLENKIFSRKVHRDEFFSWLAENQRLVQFIFHLGARTDTTEFDKKVFEKLNLDYSKKVWQACTEHGIPLVYASSAATYGAGELGYVDDHEIIHKLKPLNPYGESKNEFDKWALAQGRKPYFWAGLKFFNVFGPNEYHKGRMASVVFHTYKKIQETGQMELFRSHRPEYEDGGQARDFVYVKDVADVMFFMMGQRKYNGLFNLGTGKARTFNDLAGGVFDALGQEPVIKYIDTPSDIRASYQYFTEARMDKLKMTGYPGKFYFLEEGIKDYIQNYLVPQKIR